jgi:hypothetical protein
MPVSGIPEDYTRLLDEIEGTPPISPVPKIAKPQELSVSTPIYNSEQKHAKYARN